MTTQEKQIKIAEIMGWKFRELQGFEGASPFDCVNPSGVYCHSRSIPPFTESIDSIRDAVLAQTSEFQEQFDLEIKIRFKRHQMVQITADDWCDAFLAAHDASKGKGG